MFLKDIFYWGGHTALAHVWRSENDLKVSVLTFFHVSPRMELRQSDLVASSFMH